MKTAEQWVNKEQNGPDKCKTFSCSDLYAKELIRAIQDDARGDGMSIVLDRIRNSDVAQELLKASAQMRIADRDPRGDITGFEIQSARDNATEHRRIAEAYIQLAQTMKA
jgi:hypothetical protein